jgi:hypothetical protein
MVDVHSHSFPSSSKQTDGFGGGLGVWVGAAVVDGHGQGSPCSSVQPGGGLRV